MLRFLMPLATAWAVLIGLSDGRKSGDRAMLTLHLRTRLQPFKDDTTWKPVEVTEKVPAAQSAVIICDMWDDHWCKNAARRCGELAKKMAPVIDAARSAGATIIHAPSDCM